MEHEAESDNVKFLLSDEEGELLLVLILNIVKTSSVNPLHVGDSFAANSHGLITVMRRSVM